MRAGVCGVKKALEVDAGTMWWRELEWWRGRSLKVVDGCVRGGFWRVVEGSEGVGLWPVVQSRGKLRDWGQVGCGRRIVGTREN